jgi:ribokinase
MINVIADRYAQALFEVGEETQTTSELYQELKQLVDILNENKDLYNFIDYLILNETECEILSGQYPSDESSIRIVYEKLGVNNLIITLGSKGSLLVKKDEIIKINPNKVDAVDTTAAGDTYVGVFASQLVKGKTEIDSLNYASIASSLTCLKEGAQQSIPFENEVLEYLNK